MSGDETRLARWSRRKREAALKTRAQPKPESADATAPGAPPAAPPAEEGRSGFDLRDLPSIDSIGGGSDIRAFLVPGVPAELMRAALRRAWSTETAIRDFIGLSENSWDFNAPGGVPGFGAVTAEDVRRLARLVLGEPEPTDQASKAEAGSSPPDRTVPANETDPGAQAFAPNQMKDDRPAADNQGDPQRSEVGIAMQQDSGKCESFPLSPRRGHGGALPK